MDGEEWDARLDDVLVGGREQREIVIVDYDPGWPRRFEVERDRVRGALGFAALRVEHVGSTAVPGLAAKPIIDLLVAVVDPEDDALFVPALESAGYELRVREPRHRMFRTPSRDVHVHLWADDDEQLTLHLAFRDRLRESPEDRALYERLKRDLAGQQWGDMYEYSHAKGRFIEAVLAKVRE
ncbi:MAG: GrpB family protein [Solirubrobacteraceae bacterium]